MVSDVGALLVESGVINESQLQQALTATVGGSGLLVQNLIRLGFVSDAQLASFLASRLQIPLAEMAQFENLPAFITRLVPMDVVMTYRAIPIMLHQGVLHMAMSDPTNRNALEEISFITGYSASPVAAADHLVEEAMARYYGIPPDDAVPELSDIPAAPSRSLAASAPASIGSRDPAPGPSDSGTFAIGPVTPAQPAQAASVTSRVDEPAPQTVLKPESMPQKQKLPDRPPPPQVVEVAPAAGELEELFGMGRSDEEVIHLTQPKQGAFARSITDAIRIQVARETGEMAEAADELPPSEPPDATAADLPPHPPLPQAAGPGAEEDPQIDAVLESAAEPPPAVATDRLVEPKTPDLAQASTAAATTFPGPFSGPQSELPSSANSGTIVVADGSNAPGAGLPDISQIDSDDELPALRDSDEARYLISQASERDEIARALVRYTRSFMPRVVLFIVKKDLLVGWLGVGEGVSQKQVKGIMIPLNSASVFRTVKETSTDYFGSLPRTTVNDIFLSAIGDIRPRQVLLIPVSVRHKAICILYGDCGTEAGFARDLSGIHLIISDAAAAFEKIILEKKINRLINK